MPEQISVFTCFLLFKFAVFVLYILWLGFKVLVRLLEEIYLRVALLKPFETSLRFGTVYFMCRVLDGLGDWGEIGSCCNVAILYHLTWNSVGLTSVKTGIPLNRRPLT